MHILLISGSSGKCFIGFLCKIVSGSVVVVVVVIIVVVGVVIVVLLFSPRGDALPRVQCMHDARGVAAGRRPPAGPGSRARSSTSGARHVARAPSRSTVAGPAAVPPRRPAPHAACPGPHSGPQPRPCRWPWPWRRAPFDRRDRKPRPQLEPQITSSETVVAFVSCRLV